MPPSSLVTKALKASSRPPTSFLPRSKANTLVNRNPIINPIIPSRLIHHHQQPASNMSPHATATKGPAQPFLDAMVQRRSVYALSKEIPVPESRVQEIIRHAVRHVPSSFNSQSTRVILLVGEEHGKLWEIAKAAVKAVVSAEQWPTSEAKLNGFKAGYGTILYFDDSAIVDSMMAAFPLYASKFPGWAQESTAMHQYAVWCALAAESVGANLQHYHPLIDAAVAREWNVPASWKLRAQMVIGGIKALPAEKQFKPVEGERFLVFGA